MQTDPKSFRFAMVFISLTLSVFSTIEGYEVTAGDILFYVESVVVVWFGIEFGLRWVGLVERQELSCSYVICILGCGHLDAGRGIKGILVDSSF